MNAARFDFALSKQLKALERELQLEVPADSWPLLLNCYQKTPELISWGLVFGIWMIEYLPTSSHFCRFSGLPFDEQTKCLGRYRQIKFLGVSPAIQFLQTHVILAAYDRFRLQ